ncbi:MAG: metal-dependent hydrolase, partial [Armatimonadetes bacterium]|nr:metal-dependent hydrolase [Armatimonadota bacterium]
MDIIDVHCHYGAWNFPIPGCGTVENLLRLCDRYGIRFALTSSAEAIVFDMRRGNEALARALGRDERLLGYVYCDPRDLPGSCAEMDAYL